MAGVGCYTAQEGNRAPIPTPGANLRVEARHRLQVVAKDLRLGLHDLTEGVFITLEVRNQDLNGAPWNPPVHFPDQRCIDPGTAIGKFVVAVTSLSHLNRIFDKVRKVKGVISVFRTKGKEQVED